MDDAKPSRTFALPSPFPTPDTGRRLTTLTGGVRLQVRLPFCSCAPPVPHATDDGVCGTCGGAVRRAVGEAAQGEEYPVGG